MPEAAHRGRRFRPIEHAAPRDGRAPEVDRRTRNSEPGVPIPALQLAVGDVAGMVPGYAAAQLGPFVLPTCASRRS